MKTIKIFQGFQGNEVVEIQIDLVIWREYIMRNQKASYWRYTGNHPNGENCSRVNPYGYPQDLVEWMAFHQPEGTKVTGSKSDGFGNEVHVSAPKEVWEAEWIKMATSYGYDRTFDTIEKDGLVWGVNKDLEDHYTELFFVSEDQTKLEMVQAGYVPTQYDLDGDRLWVPCKSVAKA